MTHINSGLGTSKVTADTVSGYVRITISGGSQPLTQYIVAKPGQSTIFLATYITGEINPGELRWLARLKRAAVPTGWHGDVANLDGCTAFEGKDTFKCPNGQTRCKMYTSDRFIDDQVHGVTGKVRLPSPSSSHFAWLTTRFFAECRRLDDHARRSLRDLVRRAIHARHQLPKRRRPGTLLVHELGPRPDRALALRSPWPVRHDLYASHPHKAPPLPSHTNTPLPKETAQNPPPTSTPLSSTPSPSKATFPPRSAAPSQATPPASPPPSKPSSTGTTPKRSTGPSLRPPPACTPPR